MSSWIWVSVIALAVSPLKESSPFIAACMGLRRPVNIPSSRSARILSCTSAGVVGGAQLGDHRPPREAEVELQPRSVSVK